MAIKIALGGNPNSGKTTLFNALTGSNQYVGNWPGVTVEKKEGKLKGEKDVTVIDLPGIYSLSPYTLEEVVSRNYLIDESPDVILNIIDGTNLERNLFLTLQFIELGIPVVAAINMMDVLRKNGDTVNIERLSKELGCKVVEISALKGDGVIEAAREAVSLAKNKVSSPVHKFSDEVEKSVNYISENLLSNLPIERRRWYGVKLFERDEKITEKLKLSNDAIQKAEKVITGTEENLDDDSESIITTERYEFITSIIKDCSKIKDKGKMSISDKIDRIVTNRFLALPIFALVMFIVYYVSVTSVGTIATDWANDGVFGDGWRLFGVGTVDYENAVAEYELETEKVLGFLAAADEAGVDISAIAETLEEEEADGIIVDEFLKLTRDAKITGTAEIADEDGNVSKVISVTTDDFVFAIETSEPDPGDFGIWIPGIPPVVESFLVSLGTAEWLQSLILDGIIGGVGAVLGFVPQIFILFIFLAFLEGCGYMARIAFILDRIFKKFGLSGKSFIPILIGTGCGVPGIMASRTIENEHDRRMTIITTTFIPCSAKLPIIALIAGALFGGAWWVAPSAYFLGIAAIISSGIILKKTRMFGGSVTPFVMELPSYHWPTVGAILRSMWERGWSFIKKAGTIILLATIFVWFTSNFGILDGRIAMVDMDKSILAVLGNGFAWIFAPLGWGDWKFSVAAITGLIAKENVVGTFGVLFGYSEVADNGLEVWTMLSAALSGIAAYSFLAFNLLCAPCFAAMGAIRREMNNPKWFWFAISYQCGFAYLVALWVYQIGLFASTGTFSISTFFAFVSFLTFIFLLFKRNRKVQYA